MAEKLEPFNLEKVPRRPKVGMEYAHIQAMRADDKTHNLWMTGVRHVKYCDDPESCVAILHCDQCVPAPVDEVEIMWRIPHMIATEEDMRKMLREPGTEFEPVSEQGMRLVEDEFSKDKKQ